MKERGSHFVPDVLPVIPPDSFFDDNVSGQENNAGSPSSRRFLDAPSPLREAVALSGERKALFAAQVTRFLKHHVPRDMSLPVAHELVRQGDLEREKYADKYRSIYTQLQNMLGEYIPGLPLPSFDALCDYAPQGGEMQRQALILLETRCAPVLPAHTFSEVKKLFLLLSAFAENIGNARCMQTRGPVHGEV